MKKCVIIYNKKSGKVKKKELTNYFYDVITSYGYDLEVITTKRKGHGEEICKNLPDDIDLVIAAGGDGTFDEVVKGNLERENKLLLAHLPLGTVNDVGTMYGFTKNYKKDLELILNGVKKNVDIIMINDVPFVYVATIGSFTNISYDTPKKLKERFGRLGYVLFGLSELNQRVVMNHLRFKIDGVEREGDYSYIFVSNSNRIAGVDNVYPDAKLDDNKFEVLFCNLKTKGSIAKSIFHVITQNGLENVPNCEYYCTDNLEIKFDEIPKYSWGLDGEEFKQDTRVFKFSVNKEINVLLPTSNIDKLFVNKEKN